MTQTPPKVIQTHYNGYHFRSRLEARYAVFFEALGIPYAYEVEGFDLDGLWYLPDFFLTALQVWVEIKPDIPTAEEREKAIRLCLATRRIVVVLTGDPGSDISCRSLGFIPAFFADTTTPVQCMRDGFDTYYRNHHLLWLSKYEVIVCSPFPHPNPKKNFASGSEPFGFDLERGYNWGHAECVACVLCRRIGYKVGGFFTCPDCFPNFSQRGCRDIMHSDQPESWHVIDVSEAARTAKSARFEGGKRS